MLWILFYIVIIIFTWDVPMLHLDPPHNHGLPNENPVDGVSENQVNQGQPETETETETVPEETWTLEHE